MYPLCDWPYTKLCDRLDKLHELGFHEELVVSCAQTIEQVVRRIMKQYMTVHKATYAPNMNAGGKWEQFIIYTKEERDQALGRLQSIDSLKKSWAKIMKPHQIQPLPAIIDTVCGNNTWNILNSTHTVVLSGHTKSCSTGFFQLRHKLVHSVNAPIQHDLIMLSTFGMEVVKHLMHPETGISLHVAWSPTKRISRWKS